MASKDVIGILIIVASAHSIVCYTCVCSLIPRPCTPLWPGNKANINPKAIVMLQSNQPLDVASISAAYCV